MASLPCSFPSASVLFAVLLSSEGHSQVPCDPSIHYVDERGFDRIFGCTHHAWQLCGDTVQAGEVMVVYSYPACSVRAVDGRGRVLWDTGIEHLGGCKLMGIHAIPDRASSRRLRKHIAAVQYEDKRIFLLKKRTGRGRYITHDELNALGRKERATLRCRPRKRDC